MRDDDLVGMLFGGLILTGFTAIVGGFLHYRRERLLTHRERMKALELGLPLPEDPQSARLRSVVESARAREEEAAAKSKQAYQTGLWGAFWGFIAAAGIPWHSGVSYVMAAAAGAVGITGIICGTILAARETRPASPVDPREKPTYEPDAFDVVSRRG